MSDVKIVVCPKCNTEFAQNAGRGKPRKYCKVCRPPRPPKAAAAVVAAPVAVPVPFPQA